MLQHPLFYGPEENWGVHAEENNPMVNNGEKYSIDFRRGAVQITKSREMWDRGHRGTGRECSKPKGREDDKLNSVLLQRRPP